MRPVPIRCRTIGFCQTWGFIGQGDRIRRKRNTRSDVQLRRHGKRRVICRRTAPRLQGRRRRADDRGCTGRHHRLFQGSRLRPHHGRNGQPGSRLLRPLEQGQVFGTGFYRAVRSFRPDSRDGHRQRAAARQSEHFVLSRCRLGSQRKKHHQGRDMRGTQPDHGSRLLREGTFHRPTCRLQPAILVDEMAIHRPAFRLRSARRQPRTQNQETEQHPYLGIGRSEHHVKGLHALPLPDYPAGRRPDYGHRRERR